MRMTDTSMMSIALFLVRGGRALIQPARETGSGSQILKCKQQQQVRLR